MTTANNISYSFALSEIKIKLKFSLFQFKKHLLQSRKIKNKQKHFRKIEMYSMKMNNQIYLRKFSEYVEKRKMHI